MSRTHPVAVEGHRKSRTTLLALVGVATLMFGILLSAAPAHAAAANCDPNKRLCGWIGNKGSISIKIGTDYNGSGGLQSGAWQRTLASGGHSGGITPQKDWDAVWVPAGHCLKTMGGPGQGIPGWNNRVNSSTGIWHKVDDFGAYVWLKKGSCP